MESKIRLNKFLAERLGISRREADELISAGKVTINGKKANLGDRIQITPTSIGAGEISTERSDIGETERTEPVQQPEIRCSGKLVPFNTDYIYLAFNKPVGYVCSRRAQGSAPTLYELLPPKYQKLKTVGRLDKDSSGLILLTNDGDFAFRMTHPKFRKEKVYEIELDKPLAPLHQQMISDFGVMLDDGPSKFTVIRDGKQYIVTLTEGRNRQIRRTFAVLGYTVTKLHRTKFGKYELGKLAPNSYE